LTSKPSSGFTLVEVMVALAIVSLALFAIMEVQLSARKQWAQTREMSTATLLARLKMAELELLPFDEIQPERGEFENYPMYSYEIQLNPFMNVERTYEVTVVIQGPNHTYELAAIISDILSADPDQLGITSQSGLGFPVGLDPTGQAASQPRGLR